MKKIFFLALAGAVIAACAQPGERVPSADDSKSVSISVRYDAPSTRVESDYAVTHNRAVTALEDATLYFFNSGGMVVHTWSLTDPTQTEFVIEDVPAVATSVGMIANRAEDLTAGNPATLAEFRAMSMGIDNQASMSDATGGTVEAPDAVQGIALLDAGAAGTGNSANPLNAITDEDFTHTAAITVSPAVSRIEIAPEALIVKDGNSKYLEKFNFTGIYINNYSPTFTLGLAQASSLFGAGIQGGGNANWAAAYNALLPSEFLSDEPTGAIEVDTTVGIGGYAYHVFPGAPMPHIIIRGEDFVHDGEPDGETRYWLIDKFYKNSGTPEAPAKGALIDRFLPGFVYRISSIAVGDTYPTDDPYDDPVSVEVTVTVSAWQVQQTYVEPD